MEEQLSYEEKNKYIKAKLSETKIDPVYQPIIASIIIRRSSCFNLSDELFRRDVESFVKNVDCIRVSDNELGDNNGGFDQENREIVLNKKIFEEEPIEKQEGVLESAREIAKTNRILRMYRVLAHECTHAMNFEENEIGIKEDRTFLENNFFIGSDGIMEAFTEAEADALSYKHPIEMIEGGHVYRRLTEGYTKIEGYVELLAATFGVNRNELLGAAIKGPEELQSLLNSNIEIMNENTGKNKIFEGISYNISLVHAAKSIQNPEIRAENVRDADKKIYTFAEIGIDNRIANLELNDIKDFKKQFDRIKIEQKIVSSIIGSDRPTKDAEDLKQGTNGKYEVVNTKILCIEEILQNDNIKDKSGLIRKLQEMHDIEEITKFIEENEIDIDENKKLEDTISKESIDEYNKEHSQVQWDNTDIIEYISTHRDKLQNTREQQPNKFQILIAKAILKLGSLFNKIGDFANKIFGKEEQKLLPSGSERFNDGVAAGPIVEEPKSWELSNYGIDKNEFMEESIRIVEEHVSREEQTPAIEEPEESHEII